MSAIHNHFYLLQVSGDCETYNFHLSVCYLVSRLSRQGPYNYLVADLQHLDTTIYRILSATKAGRDVNRNDRHYYDTYLFAKFVFMNNVSSIGYGCLFFSVFFLFCVLVVQVERIYIFFMVYFKILSVVLLVQWLQTRANTLENKQKRRK